jgi:peptide/nickel transport system permease protein
MKGQPLMGKRRRRVLGVCALLIVALVIAAIVGPIVLSRGPNDQDLSLALLVPTQQGTILGTDELGRDMLVRLLYGLRISFAVAALALVIQLVIGTPLGMIAGYFRGPIDAIVMRTADAAFALPFYLLAIVLGSVVWALSSDGSGTVARTIASLNDRASGLLGVVVALAIVFTPLQARLVRGFVMDIAAKDYIRSARAGGCSHLRVLATHVLPHALGPAIVIAFLNVPTAIVVEAGVSILGLGVAPPTASLGSLLQSGGAYITSFPHVVLVPAVALGVLVLVTNAAADTLHLELQSDAGDDDLRPLVIDKPSVAPDISPSPLPGVAGALLDVRDLVVSFPTRSEPVVAVAGVDLQIRRGERVAIVGESGSGKSTLARALVGLVPAPGQITRGSITFKQDELRGANDAVWSRVRGAEIGVVFQNALSALDPMRSIGRQVADVVTRHTATSRAQAMARAEELLSAVGLAGASQLARAYPHELSGGQRQRAMIAIALAGEPSLIIADEPTTALDVTIQAQVLDLLVLLTERTGVALLLISHDLGLVAEYCDRIIVMRNGVVVERLDASDLAARAQHEYTRSLVNAVHDLAVGR